MSSWREVVTCLHVPTIFSKKNKQTNEQLNPGAYHWLRSDRIWCDLNGTIVPLSCFSGTQVRIWKALTVDGCGGGHQDEEDGGGDELTLHVNARKCRTGMRTRRITKAQLLTDILLCKRMRLLRRSNLFCRTLPPPLPSSFPPPTPPLSLLTYPVSLRCYLHPEFGTGAGDQSDARTAGEMTTGFLKLYQSFCFLHRWYCPD